MSGSLDVPEHLFTAIDHVGIAVTDLDAAIAFYRETFGMETVHEETNEEQGVREAMLKINETPDGGASYLQLLEPTREDSAVGKWLAKNGPGMHHVAYRTDDIDSALGAVRDAGLRLIDAEPRLGIRGSRVAFLHPKSTGGVLTELVEPVD